MTPLEGGLTYANDTQVYCRPRHIKISQRPVLFIVVHENVVLGPEAWILCGIMHPRVPGLVVLHKLPASIAVRYKNIGHGRDRRA
jgi:hypothetical protein